jgi:hypothetical protein
MRNGNLQISQNHYKNKGSHENGGLSDITKLLQERQWYAWMMGDGAGRGRLHHNKSYIEPVSSGSKGQGLERLTLRITVAFFFLISG